MTRETSARCAYVSRSFLTYVQLGTSSLDLTVQGSTSWNWSVRSPSAWLLKPNKSVKTTSDLVSGSKVGETGRRLHETGDVIDRNAHTTRRWGERWSETCGRERGCLGPTLPTLANRNTLVCLVHRVDSALLC